MDLSGSMQQQMVSNSNIHDIPSYININSDQVNEDVFVNYGGKILTALIVCSFVLFIILFYDSSCVERINAIKQV